MIVNSSLQTADWPELDLIVTSPPYKDEDGYTEDLIKDFGRLSFSNLKNDSLMFMNFGHLANFKSRPFKSAILLENCGFVLVDTITWVKNHYRPIQGKRRVNNLTEFIFMFAKGSPVIDRLSIGVPYKDKSNIKRWSASGGSDLKCRGNVWEIPYDTIQDKAEKLHNDRFPLELPTLCIKLSNIPTGSLVGDPFMGSGTTALAAKNCNMDYWGCEVSKAHYDTTVNRLK